MKLPAVLLDKYYELKPSILNRLNDFAQVDESDYFYEFCYCICTPQSKALNASIVVDELKKFDFLYNDFNPVSILRNPKNYIRFHNKKSERLIYTKKIFPYINDLISAEFSPETKRELLADNFNGFGMKEASHFLRNIGYKNLAILDRHILKNLTYCKVFNEIPRIKNKKHYLEIEDCFKNFAKAVQISIDELDLLFWSYETGIILK